MSGAEIAMIAIAGGSLITQGLATGRSAAYQRTQGKIAYREAEIEAKQIELAAIQREADRKAELARAMASQIAYSGIRGVSAFEGSPLTLLQADIEAEETATQRDIMQSKLAAMTTRARGRIAKETAKAGAGLSLLKGYSQIGLQSADLMQTVSPLKEKKTPDKSRVEIEEAWP